MSLTHPKSSKSWSDRVQRLTCITILRSCVIFSRNDHIRPRWGKLSFCWVTLTSFWIELLHCMNFISFWRSIAVTVVCLLDAGNNTKHELTIRKCRRTRVYFLITKLNKSKFEAWAWMNITMARPVVDRSFPAKGGACLRPPRDDPANLRTDDMWICGRRVFYRARVKSFYSFPALPQKRNRGRRDRALSFRLRPGRGIRRGAVCLNFGQKIIFIISSDIVYWYPTG